MKNNANTDDKLAQMTFASVYPLYLAKVVKKGRTQEELDQVIEWLTGYGPENIQDLIATNVTFREFFANAKLNPNANQITGVICGHRVEQIANPLTQKIRYLDKLVDGLAKGKEAFKR